MSHGRRRKRGQEEEAPENHERWLLTYADMITLLMVLFIVMYAISVVDKQKFAALASGLSTGFGRPVQVLQNNDGILSQDGSNQQSTQLGVVGLDVGVKMSKAVQRQAQNVITKQAQAREAMRKAEAQAQYDTFEQVRKEIRKALARKGMQKAIDFSYDERGLVLNIVTDKVLFPAQLAVLQPAGRRVLDAVTPVVRTLPNDVVVVGHTNQASARPTHYPSEWELSTARASSVVRYLIARGLAATRLSAVGFADQRPRYSGHEGIVKNRRVEIVIASTLGPESKALLTQVAREAGSATR